MANFFFQAEDGIRDGRVTGVQTCALPISVIVNMTIDAPAYLYLDLEYYDGGSRFEQLSFGDFMIGVTTNGTNFIAHENPIPVNNYGTIGVQVIAKSNFTTGAVLYGGSYSSAAPGSTRVLRILFDTNALTMARFVPAHVVFRPYDSTTGAGLPIEQFNVTIQFPDQSILLSDGETVVYHTNNESAVGLGTIDTVYGVPMIVRVRDYFGNLLYTQN